MRPLGAQLAMNEYPTLIDPGHIRAARGVQRSLPSDAADQVLLFTDLHGDNVLGAQRSPWLAIDPKPHIGDPAFDLVMHIGTSYSRMTSDPAALAARMAALTDVDASRVQLWLFARAVAEATRQTMASESDHTTRALVGLESRLGHELERFEDYASDMTSGFCSCCARSAARRCASANSSAGTGGESTRVTG